MFLRKVSVLLSTFIPVYYSRSKQFSRRMSGMFTGGNIPWISGWNATVYEKGALFSLSSLQSKFKITISKILRSRLGSCVPGSRIAKISFHNSDTPVSYYVEIVQLFPVVHLGFKLNWNYVYLAWRVWSFYENNKPCRSVQVSHLWCSFTVQTELIFNVNLTMLRCVFQRILLLKFTYCVKAEFSMQCFYHTM